MSSWRPSVPKAGGFNQSYTARKQVWVAKPIGAATSTSSVAASTKAEVARVLGTGDRPGDAQQQGAATAAPTRTANTGKRIYKRAMLLRLRDEVATPVESPMKSLCMQPRLEESGLRADAPEYDAAAAEAWSFDYSSWSGLEVPIWEMDNYRACMPIPEGKVGSKFISRSPGSTMCNTKTDVSEEDVSSSATAFSIQNSPAVLPAPPPLVLDPALREAQARSQIEYYFCAKNLINDWYLRSLMDDDGWVPMKEILQFPRLTRLGLFPKETAVALLGSSIVEVTWEESPRVRLRDVERRAQFPRYDEAAAAAAAFAWLPEGVDPYASACYGYAEALLETGMDFSAGQVNSKSRQRRKKDKREAQGQATTT